MRAEEVTLFLGEADDKIRTIEHLEKRDGNPVIQKTMR